MLGRVIVYAYVVLLMASLLLEQPIPFWRAPQFLWAEPMLVSSLTVWRAAAVMWAGVVLAASGEVGDPQTGRRPQAALSSFGGRL